MSSAPTASRPTVGIVGLGLMGTAIATRFLEHGYPVVVWNRSADKAAPLVARGAVWSDRPFAICQRVIISLYSSDVVATVIGQMQADLRPGQTVIDTTTGEPESAVAMNRQLKQQGVDYLDAPISGSSEQTRRGEALVMVGGESAVFQACADLWSVLGRRVLYVGPSSSAAKLKLVTNLVLGLNRAALAEGLVYAQSLDIDLSAALEVLRESAAYSRTMDVKGPKMIAGDFSVQARLSQHLKDVRLILASAAAAGLSLPLSQTHRELLEQAEAAGHGELDNCAVIKAYGRKGE
ncbi:MAG: NAD(P)-dependent oxidoreductase [Planctomycetaceae bacterium]|nr:NAD(P)-dependent oxidoreductase [Planctomycetaceae bacterium]